MKIRHTLEETDSLDILLYLAQKHVVFLLTLALILTWTFMFIRVLT